MTNYPQTPTDRLNAQVADLAERLGNAEHIICRLLDEAAVRDKRHATDMAEVNRRCDALVNITEAWVKELRTMVEPLLDAHLPNFTRANADIYKAIGTPAMWAKERGNQRPTSPDDKAI